MIGYQRPVLSSIASKALEATNQTISRITTAATARGHRQGGFFRFGEDRGSINSIPLLPLVPTVVGIEVPVKPVPWSVVTAGNRSLDPAGLINDPFVSTVR